MHGYLIVLVSNRIVAYFGASVVHQLCKRERGREAGKAILKCVCTVKGRLFLKEKTKWGIYILTPKIYIKATAINLVRQ